MRRRVPGAVPGGLVSRHRAPLITRPSYSLYYLRLPQGISLSVKGRPPRFTAFVPPQIVEDTALDTERVLFEYRPDLEPLEVRAVLFDTLNPGRRPVSIGRTGPVAIYGAGGLQGCG